MIEGGRENTRTADAKYCEYREDSVHLHIYSFNSHHLIFAHSRYIFASASDSKCRRRRRWGRRIFVALALCRQRSKCIHTTTYCFPELRFHMTALDRLVFCPWPLPTVDAVVHRNGIKFTHISCTYVDCRSLWWCIPKRNYYSSADAEEWWRREGNEKIASASLGWWSMCIVIANNENMWISWPKVEWSSKFRMSVAA